MGRYPWRIPGVFVLARRIADYRGSMLYWKEYICSPEDVAVLIGLNLPLYPTKALEQISLLWMGCPCVIYNAKVQEVRHYHRFSQRMADTVGKEAPIVQQDLRFIRHTTLFVKQVSGTAPPQWSHEIRTNFPTVLDNPIRVGLSTVWTVGQHRP